MSVIESYVLLTKCQKPIETWLRAAELQVILVDFRENVISAKIAEFLLGQKCG